MLFCYVCFLIAHVEKKEVDKFYGRGNRGKNRLFQLYPWMIDRKLFIADLSIETIQHNLNESEKCMWRFYR